MTLDATRCYEALLSRDPRFDGRFFTGVITTGIYCRPICPSRIPRLKNLRFFHCAAAAEAAGFRPCRRCHPEAAPGTPAWSGTSAVVSRALRLIADHGLDDSSVGKLAGRLGLGDRHLRRLFATHLGASPIQVATARRVHFARTLVDDTTLPITQIAFASGFQSLRQFNHAMRATFGRSPRELRRSSKSGRKSDELFIRLPYRPPLDWPQLLGFLAVRATPGVEVVEDGHYRRTIDVDGRAGCIDVRHDEHTHTLLMRLDGANLDGLLATVERARRLFDLSADPETIIAQLATDPLLRSVVRRGIRVPGAWDPFELAVRAILGQQISVKGATTLAGRLVARFGRRIEGLSRVGLTHLAPRPADLAEAGLESVGLPKARANTIRALAREVANGTLRLDASQGLGEVVTRLCEIPGLGDWTAQYIAMRAFGEPDAFPASDLGLRKAAGNGHGPISSGELERMARKWRPWRAYAAMALWMRSVDSRQSSVDSRQSSVESRQSSGQSTVVGRQSFSRADSRQSSVDSRQSTVVSRQSSVDSRQSSCK
jgi:AraC family transcriptional regulator of adaptative response / DNA-3-methyladenine glycosylase II